MSKNLFTQKNILIVLGIIAIIGITYISATATSPSKPTARHSTTHVPQPKTAKMMPPVKDTPVAGQIIVKFKPQYTTAQINAYLQQFHASIKETITGINQTVVKVPAGQEDTISQELKNGPYIEAVQRDYTTHAFFTPDDPYFDVQYAFNNTGQAVLGHAGTANADIHAEEAWGVTQGSGVKVAILDTGINLNQPDLAGKVILQKSFVSGVTSVEDGSGHGTHVAGIIAADTNNGVGVAGTCPGCELIIGKILDDSGSGTSSDAVAGITWAAQNGAKVINMSLGTTDSSSESLYQQAVTYATQQGAIVVAAAGNDGINQMNYPAAVPGVVSVAATTNTDAKASYSNFGSWVQIAAPGDNILSTGPTHTFQIEPFGYDTSAPYYYLSGTSMATPYVSGVAALIASTSYGTTPQAVINRLYSTADKIAGTGTDWVNGRVDAAAAVGTAPTTASTAPSLITPTLYCVGGNGTPPCATIAPSGTGSSAPATSTSPQVSGSTNPSGAGGGGGSANGSPSVSPSSGAAISGTPGSNTPGTGGVCTNLSQLINNATSSQATHDTKIHFKCETGGGKGGNGGGGNSGGGGGFNGGFLSKLITLLLELILEILKQCSTQTTTPTPNPTVSPAPSTVVSPTSIPSQAPSSTPSQAVSPTSTVVSPTTAPSGIIIVSPAVGSPSPSL